VFGHSEVFMAMRRLAMARNFSWTRSAGAYQDLYARALAGLRAHRVA
jgi:glycogen synthase